MSTHLSQIDSTIAPARGSSRPVARRPRASPRNKMPASKATASLTGIADTLDHLHAEIEQHTGGFEKGRGAQLMKTWWKNADLALEQPVMSAADVEALARVCRVTWARTKDADCDLRDALNQKLTNAILATTVASNIPEQTITPVATIANRARALFGEADCHDIDGDQRSVVGETEADAKMSLLHTEAFGLMEKAMTMPAQSLIDVASQLDFAIGAAGCLERFCDDDERAKEHLGAVTRVLTTGCLEVAKAAGLAQSDLINCSPSFVAKLFPGAPPAPVLDAPLPTADAELIELCVKVIELEDDYARTLNGQESDGSEEIRLDEVREQIANNQQELVERSHEMRATTFEGLQARARALLRIAPDIKGRGQAGGYTSDQFVWLLVRDLLDLEPGRIELATHTSATMSERMAELELLRAERNATPTDSASEDLFHERVERFDDALLRLAACKVENIADAATIASVLLAEDTQDIADLIGPGEAILILLRSIAEHAAPRAEALPAQNPGQPTVEAAEPPTTGDAQLFNLLEQIDTLEAQWVASDLISSEMPGASDDYKACLEKERDLLDQQKPLIALINNLPTNTVAGLKARAATILSRAYGVLDNDNFNGMLLTLLQHLVAIDQPMAAGLKLH